jgi:hypothetical protein
VSPRLRIATHMLEDSICRRVASGRGIHEGALQDAAERTPADCHTCLKNKFADVSPRLRIATHA